MREATSLLKSSNRCIVLNEKTAAVGDIYGCLKDLHVIIAELKSQLAKGEIDHVLFLGDIIDRGPSSFIALKYLLDFFLSDPDHVHMLSEEIMKLHLRGVW